MFEINENPKTLQLFLMQTLTIILYALPVGILDMLCQRYREKNKLSKFKRILLILAELVITIIYVYTIMINVPYIADTFQTTLPGMFFPGIFYALQYNMVTDIQIIMKEVL